MIPLKAASDIIFVKFSANSKPDFLIYIYIYIFEKMSKKKTEKEYAFKYKIITYAQHVQNGSYDEQSKPYDLQAGICDERNRI